jgi:hypothetical protein
MTRDSARQPGLQVHSVTSAEGQVILLGQRLTTADLARAVALYQATEHTQVGTWIGIHEQYGFFFSPNPRWSPNDADAFASPLGNIPWVQIHELLGNLPEGATADYFDSNGKTN